jgi:hypothetical protein
VPVSVSERAGLPLAVTVKRPTRPIRKVALELLVIAGAETASSPIRLEFDSANQTLPLPSTVIPFGPLLSVGLRYSLIDPEGGDPADLVRDVFGEPQVSVAAGDDVVEARRQPWEADTR